MASAKMYISNSCGYCHAAQRLLKEKRVDYELIVVDGNLALRQEAIALSGQRTVPQIWIGDTHVGGFTDLRALEQRGELDKMLGGC